MPIVVLLLIVLLTSFCQQGESVEADPSGVETGDAWLTEITEAVDLEFLHTSSPRGGYLMTEIMGSGGALLDYDGDGLLDVFLISSGSLEDDRPSAEASDRLFRQTKSGRFEDVTDRAGVGSRSYGMGCAVGDIDNDGDPDILVTNFGPDHLYRNNGNGTFTDVASERGITGEGWSTSADFLDYDADGYLDLYVARYVQFDPPKACTDPAGRPDYCGPRSFAGVSDILYHNNGDGSFSEVTLEAGMGHAAGKGLGVVTADFSGNGRPDIYVANDGEENHLWINLGKGRFEDQALIRGVALNVFGKAEASMGLAVGDIENDGDLDLLVTHLDRETNTLYINLGEGYFEDRSAGSGLGTESLPFTGFGTAFWDFDMDSDLDVLAVNGHVRRTDTALEMVGHSGGDGWSEFMEPNLLFENDGSGRFKDVSDKGGRLTQLVEVSRGAILGDIDLDGDLDVLTTNTNGPARLFRNNIPRTGKWVGLRLLTPEGRDAIGAVVKISSGGKEYLRTVSRNSSYLSSRPATLLLGIGKSEEVDSISVHWPDGSSELFSSVPANQYITIVHGQGQEIVSDN